MSAFYAFTIAALAFGLMFLIHGRMQRLQREFGFAGGFPGAGYESVVTFAHAESGYRCRAGADAEALYLIAPADRGRRGGFGGEATEPLRSDLRIPWNQMETRPGNVFLKKILWFHLRARGLSFYMPSDVGERLLADAGRSA
jgi:hypothetical protein